MRLRGEWIFDLAGYLKSPLEHESSLHYVTPMKESELRTAEARNVLGGSLGVCCLAPITGFYRTGTCLTGPEDTGQHTVCAQMSEEFLAFSKMRGNDLSTPQPGFGFPGLQPGDCWCLCVLRWKEALAVNMAPPVMLAATHEAALKYVTLEELIQHALDAPDSGDSISRSE